MQEGLSLGEVMGGFPTWRKSVITERQKAKLKTESGDQAVMEWSLTRTKFDMDDLQGLIAMIDNVTRKEAGALEDEIGSGNVHHPREILGGEEEQMNGILMEHMNGQTEGGNDVNALKIILAHLEYSSTNHYENPGPHLQPHQT